MKRLVPFLFVPLLITACSSNYVIEGTSTMSNLEGKFIYLKVFREANWMAIDSSEVIHGLFNMKGKADSVMLTTLFIENQSLMPVILEKGKIKISLAYNDLSARGTYLNDQLYTFLDKKDEMETAIYELDRQEARMVLDGRDIDDVQRELAVEGEKLIKDMDSMVKKFIIDNGENVLGPYVFMLLGNSLPYPLLTPQIEDILKDAPYSLKSDKAVKEYINKAKENMETIREHQRLEYGKKEN